MNLVKDNSSFQFQNSRSEVFLFDPEYIHSEFKLVVNEKKFTIASQQKAELLSSNLNAVKTKTCPDYKPIQKKKLTFKLKSAASPWSYSFRNCNQSNHE